jgi:hypothetical protein
MTRFKVAPTIFRFMFVAFLFYYSTFALPSANAQGTPPTRSIQEWVVGDGVHDDSLGVAQAFYAAQNGAFTLLVDCPVRIHVGMDITRPIFIGNGTSVEFSDNGLFIVDNVFIPTFVIANSSSIQLLNWNIQYVGGMPVNQNTGGYYNNGVFVAKSGYAQPAFAFITVLTHWLSNNRGIKFDQSQGQSAATWWGPTTSSAMFRMIGSTSDVVFSNFTIYVSASSGAYQFIPHTFSATEEFNSNQTVNRNTPHTLVNTSVPSNIQFENISLDGYYMGWQGTFHQATFNHIRAYRYSDLQDAEGGNVGGVGKWFAPPHLFYLNDNDTEHLFRNEDVHICDVIDYGQRLGTARDVYRIKSGYLDSLKFGAVNSTVDQYTSDRPDGLMEIQNCENVTISNVVATYDSSFINNLYAGIRFNNPADLSSALEASTNLTIKNLILTDKAAVTTMKPVGDSIAPLSSGIIFENFEVKLHKWAGEGPIAPIIKGENNQTDITFILY